MHQSFCVSKAKMNKQTNYSLQAEASSCYIESYE